MGVGATLAMLGEALGRIGHEYRDIDRARKGDMRTFDAIVYMAPLVGSERQRLIGAFRDLQKREKAPVPAGHSISVAVPPNTAFLYAQVLAPSAEAAMQLVGRCMREALSDADLTVDTIHVEVEQSSNPASREVDA